MDAGTAAVLGAAVATAGTVIGAIGGATITARVANRQAHLDARMQLREPRRDAYAEFVRVCISIEKDLWKASQRYEGGADAGTLGNLIVQQSDALDAAHAHVALEGPTEVAQAAFDVMAAVMVIHGALIGRIDDSRHAEPVDEELLELLMVRVREFTDVARRAIDAPTEDPRGVSWWARRQVRRRATR